MVKAIGIPEGDRFQVITEHGADLVYDPDYLNIHRTDEIVMIQITLASVPDAGHDLTESHCSPRPRKRGSAPQLRRQKEAN